MKIQESGENYLETILVLKLKYGAVRSIDVANELSFSKPSVSRAVSVLKSAGHITVDAKGLIELTDSGREIAETIYERHQLLTDYLMDIGVDEKTAAEDACRIEHVISPVTFEKLKQHVQKANR
ncbi:metal-dependent transcriptional regulator [Diplocloster modestus]|uniref:Metal-dependent transcriptional regulator n=1 Tax=Diplocloster modestus TaxID=2850322 RepID=A0ABS6K3L2_9FIRM|nr:metal-dependent transcriptional regulator [Diplocloster modestus]MBU9725085.1 metal-dependent transcriptional regulator [Diplocloster modestus]